MHLPPVPRFLIRSLLRTIFVLVFLGVPALVYVLREYGLEFGLKEQIAVALSGEGFQTTIGKLSLDPFQGLVARRVRVVETKNKRRDLAQIEQLVVSINFSDLLQKKISIDRIALDGTNVSIPLTLKEDGPRLNLKNVTAQAFFLPDQLRITHFETDFEGIHIVITGLLRNPEQFRATEATPGDSGAPSPADSLIELLPRLAELRFPGQAPEIRLEIEGDLADLSTLQAQPISIRSGPIVAPTWRVEGLEAKATYLAGAVTVSQLLLQGGDGETLNLSARWANQSLEFEMSSTLQPESFREMLPKESPWRELKFREAPVLEVFGRADFSASPVRYQATGSLQIEQFSWKNLAFDSLAADFAGRDGTFFVRDIRGVAKDGVLEADVYFAPEDFRLRLTNSIAPTAFLTIFGPNERQILQEMEFKDPPHVELELRGPRPDLAVLSGTGHLQLGRTAMRGSWLDWAKSDLKIGDRAVTYANFSLAHGESKGSGTFVYDFGRQQVVLSDIVSSMPPVDVLMWVDPKIAEVLKPYRFRQPPHVRGGGVIHMKDLTQNDLTLQVTAAKGLDYDLLNRTLKFGRTLAKVHIKGSKVLATVTEAELMGGEVELNANVSIDPKNPVFGAKLKLERVDFAKLTKLYFDYDDSQGVGSGDFQFQARFGEEEKLRGSGSLRVEDGRVFAIPILGPLSEIINKIIPGAGLHAAKLATADFQVANEKISSDNLSIQGTGFSMIGKGDIFFNDDRMDMSVRINARGLPGIVLFPVSKLFEYVSTGSLSDPEWRPKIVPRFGNGD